MENSGISDAYSSHGVSQLAVSLSAEQVAYFYKIAKA
jgi:hypothetical protein